MYDHFKEWWKYGSIFAIKNFLELEFDNNF